MAWAWRRLVRTGGAGRGAASSPTTTGWSRRHLLTRFRAQVGLAPKTAGAGAAVPPGGPAAGTAASAPRPGRPVRSIADVAAACGYADHAHLVREFRALAGCTPTEYLAEWT